MDTASELKLAQVAPALARKVRAASDSLVAQGFYFRVASGLRDYAEQNGLYAKGRTAPGPPVTKARGGYSNHNFGCAVDCYPFVHGATGPLDFNEPNAPEFLAMVTALKAQGLSWGGDWHSIVDKPHFQLSTVPVTPTDADRATFARGGLAAVWALYNAN